MSEISAAKRDYRGLNQHVEPRLVFLARAAARFELVEAGVMELGEAFDGLLVCLQCTCSREMVERGERDYPPARPRKRRTA